MNLKSLSALRDRALVRIVDVRFSDRDAILQTELDGDAACLSQAQVQFTIRQDLARGFLTRPAAGPVLWLQAEEPGRFRILAERAVLQGLREVWEREHTLAAYLPSARLEFFAAYASEAELRDGSIRSDLASRCTPAFESSFECPSGAAFTYTQVPACVTEPGIALRLRNALDLQDPFLQERDPRVKIRAVTENDCDPAGHPNPYILALAQRVIFGDERRFALDYPSVISVQAEVKWAR